MYYFLFQIECQEVLFFVQFCIWWFLSRFPSWYCIRERWWCDINDISSSCNSISLSAIVTRLYSKEVSFVFRFLSGNEIFFFDIMIRDIKGLKICFFVLLLVRHPRKEVFFPSIKNEGKILFCHHQDSLHQEWHLEEKSIRYWWRYYLFLFRETNKGRIAKRTELPSWITWKFNRPVNDHCITSY